MSTSRTKRPAAKRQRGRRTKPARRKRTRPNSAETAIASLAHEVRTPLTGILALGELLAASDLPTRERRWALALKSAAEHLAQLTTLVVDGVKAGRGKLRLAAGRFAPRRLAESVATTLAARADAKGLAAEVTIASDLPELVAGEPVRLRAALENLVDNAIKFTEAGQVALAVRAEPTTRGRMRLVFTVTDSGVGMSKQEIARLFRPFTQASADVADRFGGAGLGLVFVKRLARQMGGDISVASARGRGSTFRLTVVVEPVQLDAATAAPSGAAAPATGLHVLCAEDNPYGRVILNTILTELGHRVDFVGTGEAAINAVAAGAYDMVLMDLTLPGIDGIEATQRIRELTAPASRIPIVGISGHSAPGHETAARAAGMDAFLIKPLSPSALAETIATSRPRLLEVRRSVRGSA
jgi:CheY-like chemotaxis protein